MATASELKTCVEQFEKELDAVVQFWLTHSHDEKHGGFHHCLTENGEVYDTLKYGWMQGRQVWMYAKLYNSLPTYRTTAVLDAAIKGGEFLMQYVKEEGRERCWFAVTEDGRPARQQRKPYTECFYAMAMSELHRANGEHKYQAAAEAMVSQLIQWIREDDSDLGVPRLPGATPSQELGRPMMLLNVLMEYCGEEGRLRERHAGDIEWCIQEVLKHHDGQWVREHVSQPEGKPLPGSLGRLTTPGHALEAGWFLLQIAQTRGDATLQRTAIEQFIKLPYRYGWDSENEGLLYFLDTEGHSPIQLEWSMKLWWVHCEALVAHLMAYQVTGNEEHWRNFTKTWQYTLSKFSDPRHGEWYGYLTREGRVNQSFKGGPYKGCFHVPRCLLYCLQILKQLRPTSDPC